MEELLKCLRCKFLFNIALQKYNFCPCCRACYEMRMTYKGFPVFYSINNPNSETNMR